MDKHPHECKVTSAYELVQSGQPMVLLPLKTQRILEQKRASVTSEILRWLFNLLSHFKSSLQRFQ